MGVVTTERMTAELATAVADLVRRTIRPLEYYNDRAKEEELAKYGPGQLLSLIAEDRDSVLVAKIDGDLAGYCISRYDDSLVWLSWFGVDERFRGRRIGHALLEALSRTLEARRSHKMWCDTRTDNVRSQRVLTQFGFRRVGHLTNHWYQQDFYLWEWSPER